MINYFYSIFRKGCGTSFYVFLGIFSTFIFLLFFSTIGFLSLLIDYFVDTDIKILIILNLSISLIYPLFRIFIPGYNLLKKVNGYSMEKIHVLFFICFISIFLYFFIFLQFLGWELYPNQDFSVLRLLIKK